MNDSRFLAGGGLVELTDAEIEAVAGGTDGDDTGPGSPGDSNGRRAN